MSHATFSAVDHAMMGRALQLARKGQYTARPNPMVGCVITHSEQIVGEGWHHQAGTPHAEVNALAQAQSRAKGSTVYVTLEPCAHQGRTGPCAIALVNAQVRRVVVAMRDPFPEVAGKGIALLKAAGIDVSVGCMENEARQLNRAFLARVERQRPWLVVKLGCSLDGKIALKNGQSQWITSPQSRRDVQLERARSDVILTGSGTVLADNPNLQVRMAETCDEFTSELADNTLATFVQPQRVVIDSQAKLSGDVAIILDDQSPITVVNTQLDSRLPAHVTQLHTRAQHAGKVDLHHLLHQLASQNVNRIWVEAGPTLAGQLFQAQLVDELILYQAPVILGDKAQSAFALDELTALTQAIHCHEQQCIRIGSDNKFQFFINSRS